MATVSAATFGLSGAATAARNGAAIFTASLAAGEGGTVTVPSGSFACIGAALHRGVTLSLDESATLVGDPSTDTPVVTNWRFTTTGSITQWSTSLVVAQSVLIGVGDIVTVVGAGGTFDGQTKALHSRAIAVNGKTITLADEAVSTAAGQAVTAGASRIAITGGTFDGDKGETDGPNLSPIYLEQCYGATIDGVTVVDGDHGGVWFGRGCRSCTLSDSTITDCGRPADNLGSGVWVFAGGQDITISGNTITGGYHGITLDDRTTGANVNDAPVRGCTISDNTISGCDQDGVAIEGASENTISGNTISGCARGVAIGNSGQGSAELRQSSSNTVTNNEITSCGTGVRLAGVRSSQSGNTFTSCDTDVDSQEG